MAAWMGGAGRPPKKGTVPKHLLSALALLLHPPWKARLTLHTEQPSVTIRGARQDEATY